ncbi:MAG TPA: tetratricopeptide repeat protein [Polyangiaceae bacterium]|nr:tetratricopeptide repeat protein [Polyangiaceae bacterium]
MNEISRFVLGLGVAWLVATGTAPPAAAADARSTAREAYDAGTVAFEKEDYAGALAQFKTANDTLPSVQALYWIARSLDKLGQTDEAIKAYQEVADHPDSAKLGDEKRATARERLAALKAEPPAPPVPVVEELPRGPAPPGQFAPPPRGEPKMTWKNHLVELGVITGPLLLNSKHNLMAPGAQHSDYTLAWLLGARVGYYPVRFVGFEIDGAHGWGRVKDLPPSPIELRPAPRDEGAQFNMTRGYVVGQYPIGRFVPFALVGGGVIHASSDRLGDDIDFVLVGGAGAKIAVTKLFTPRLDWHLNMTQKQGGAFSEGIALHNEILLGVDFTLGR